MPMSDIGLAMAGYNPDSRIVGWISVFAGRPLFFLAGIPRTPALRSQNGNAILKYRFTGILKKEKRGESPGQGRFRARVPRVKAYVLPDDVFINI